MEAKSLIPVIFKPGEKDFTTNGLGRLIDATRCEITEEANGKYELEMDYPAISRFSDYFENGYQIKAKPNDLEEYHIFEIKQTFKDTFTNSIVIYAQSRTYKLGNRQVRLVTVDNRNGAEAMRLIEQNMDEPCDIKLYSDINTASSTVFEARNVLNCIAGEQGSLLQYWGGEIKREPFKLSLLRRRGRDNVGTVRYGKDLKGLTIKFDWQSIVTKVLPFAELQSGADGTSQRIYGNAVKSEYINKYPDVYAQYVQFTEDQGVKDLSSLNKVAGKYFTTLYPGSDKPKVSIELEIEKLTDSEEAKEFAKMRNYNLFDTFTVYHKLYDIDIQTKVTGIVYDALAEKTIKITAGDIQVAFYKQQSQDFQEFIKTLTKKDYMSDFIDYVTDLINGVKGGSILQYPKNRPHTLYFMDTDSTDTAKNVIAINNQGIGFSTTGWKGPFRNAWTIDGILNADFIRAGKIRSDIFETSFNAYGDILRLVNGALQAWNGKTKIMELTRKGMGFWDGSSHVGNMGTKGNPFPLLNDANGNPVVTDGKSLLLVGNSPTNIIGLSNEESTGLIIRGATQWNLANNSYFIGKGGNKSTIYVDRLIVGGKEVIPGDGSGGNDGDVPPELTTEKEKNAWAVWQFLKSKGYSEQAAAGILGNMDQESGIMPDIDEGGGGPGYGLVQWTSPVAGESGRAYVQRLLAQAGIGGDYRNITTQLKLLDWHMHNGQYIPSAAYPYSVAEFKALTDIGTATMAFEANFERPAVTHPERIPLAQYWYDLLHNLKPGTNKWVNPVRSSYTITQEWDEIGWGTNVIHGGIDIASMPAGSMPPVYVARSGTVETVTYDGTGGNYVVIKHDDGYWTYYGHLDSVDLSVGDKVTTNSRVGIMGATGLASGVHLHFEVWKGAQWQRINPRDVINF
ncbi:peptidoglycan DD-metalloendopeptidase family protein [Enterococcus faecalis]|uniref:phage tail spike protein n=1 Tax=Enterococcus faecalis TaxID=1351 RepID=UPI0013DE9C1D|nr:phage tail spike protein [Enterococcus faecalis]EGO2625179.1 peptidoglycan DD-metalloendopeptidase family protein [Enterococcus faecalis]EGO5143436.1 peptidoglycan DD-metalloendopeptidase family protein [Enterococcus faecalis]EGO7996266.1 peptidoglycan DD-metalloendopeptidase family protein [Enterococcus faecalis]EHA3040772.1 peptidoglycan DD-metalloendopeptidase family protein [Enterococcus faecalis]EHE8432531.1 peptidoglycan DD-metalloendopeptidase family protein [Enterococcus faecalis]